MHKPHDGSINTDHGVEFGDQDLGLCLPPYRCRLLVVLLGVAGIEEIPGGVRQRREPGPALVAPVVNRGKPRKLHVELLAVVRAEEAPEMRACRLRRVEGELLEVVRLAGDARAEPLQRGGPRPHGGALEERRLGHLGEAHEFAAVDHAVTVLVKHEEQNEGQVRRHALTLQEIPELSEAESPVAVLVVLLELRRCLALLLAGRVLWILLAVLLIWPARDLCRVWRRVCPLHGKR
mmetsp:Transcript_38574/g.120490  ORF Transcript_38574/g.120490 Transcript_38574/m.120490 type:complete len:235 (+) Transcript_38574:887-1591(+)